MTARSVPRARIEAPLRELLSLRLQLAAPEETGLWNECVQRQHYLGCKQPRGPCLRYFPLDRDGCRLGYLLFRQATHTLPCRDAWEAGRYKKHLDVVVAQPRFLLFPWAHLLGHLARRLPRDWQQRYCLCPVLLETFCGSSRFRGTCYRAANWIHLGQTQGRDKHDTRHRYNLPVKPQTSLHLPI